MDWPHSEGTVSDFQTVLKIFHNCATRRGPPSLNNEGDSLSGPAALTCFSALMAVSISISKSASKDMVHGSQAGLFVEAFSQLNCSSKCSAHRFSLRSCECIIETSFSVMVSLTLTDFRPVCLIS